jgi:hypothetical protein
MLRLFVANTPQYQSAYCLAVTDVSIDFQDCFKIIPRVHNDCIDPRLDVSATRDIPPAEYHPSLQSVLYLNLCNLYLNI